MSQPLVYIVILNYNGESWIQSCLESLSSTRYCNFKALVVDNASDDNSVEIIKRRFPQTELIVNQSNYGFSEGNNVGIHKALADEADYVVLLNPDTKVEPDWLMNLIEVGESEPRIGILGSVQLNYDNNDFNSWTRTALAHHLNELSEPGKARKWIPVDWVEGACFAVKRKVFEDIGLLDPIYFAFYEEIDFCRRAVCRGYQTVLAPRSLIHHYRGGSWQANREIKRERDYRCDRSQFIFNLTDPRKSLVHNFYWYLVTLMTKIKGLPVNFSAAQFWDLLRIQFDMIASFGKLIGKWRRERAMAKGLRTEDWGLSMMSVLLSPQSSSLIQNMSAFEFSVIIPTRNRSEDLRRCLSSIAAQNFPKDRFEVIVCDDGSDENITPMIEEARIAGLEIKHERQSQKGPAAARNLGIRCARGKIIAMTDSDTMPDRSWLQKLSEAFADNPDATGVEGKVYAENEGEFGPLGEGPSNKTGGVFLTCNCAYRRDVLLQVGGFDESFPYPAYEDTELAARVREIGRIVWQPEAMVIHPQRLLTLRSVLKKLKHWEYVLLMGYRYGYLAWERYPVKYPRLRVALLSVGALPLAKFKTATKWVRHKPQTAAKLATYGLVEALGALLIVAPKALFGRHREKIVRRNYLKSAN